MWFLNSERNEECIGFTITFIKIFIFCIYKNLILGKLKYQKPWVRYPFEEELF